MRGCTASAPATELSTTRPPRARIASASRRTETPFGFARARKARRWNWLATVAGADAVHPRIEATLRQQFAHHFYAEARRALGDHPVVAHQLARHDRRTRRAELPADAVGAAVVSALFAPICRDYAAAARAVAKRDGSASPSALLRAEPECQLDHAEAAFEDLARQGVIVLRDDRFAPGPQDADLGRIETLYAWPDESAR